MATATATPAATTCGPSRSFPPPPRRTWPSPPTPALATEDVTFSEPIDLNSFHPAGLSLTRDGAAVSLNGLMLTLTSGTTYRIGGLSSATLPNGAYVLTFGSSSVADLAGNPG